MSKILNSIWASLIVDELVRCGINQFCIAPGSRSTPLVVAVARHPKARCVVCLDERSAGFYALGYAKATHKPAVVITTSGTAVANLLPAVTEAHMDQVPMFLLTADRPEELVDTGSNQTLQQSNIFGGFLRWRFGFPCPNKKYPAEALLTTVDQAVFQSESGGPVHLNCRFREPLEPCDESTQDAYTSKISQWASSGGPFTSYHQPQMDVSEKSLDTILEIIRKTDKGLIVIGGLKTDAERKKILTLSNQLNWPVYADITSGLRLTNGTTSCFRYFDQQILSIPFKQTLKPSVILHFGGRTTSKRLDQFFDECRPDSYIVIQPTPNRYDRIHAVTMRVQANSGRAAEQISGRITVKQASAYSKLLSNISNQTDDLIAQMIKENPQLNEPFVARHLSAVIPDDSCLFVSNSMPVRDMDLYSVNNRKAVLTAANRGVSGIDGILSTAIGMTDGRRSLTTLVIGDMAFFYDLNALALLRSQTLPVVIVVINNHGGGIFDFLPISGHKDVLEKYFVAKHDFNFSGICDSFKIDYCKVCTKENFVQAYDKAVIRQVPSVIEVSADRKANLQLRRRIKSEIIELLEQSVKR